MIKELTQIEMNKGKIINGKFWGTLDLESEKIKIINRESDSLVLETNFSDGYHLCQLLRNMSKVGRSEGLSPKNACGELMNIKGKKL